MNKLEALTLVSLLAGGEEKWGQRFGLWSFPPGRWLDTLLVGYPADFFLSQNFERLDSDALAPYSESLCKILASSDFFTPIFSSIKVMPRRTACTAQ